MEREGRLVDAVGLVLPKIKRIDLGWADYKTCVLYDQLQSKNVFFDDSFYYDREREYHAWCKEERAQKRNPPFNGFYQEMKKLHKDIMDNFDQYFVG